MTAPRPEQTYYTYARLFDKPGSAGMFIDDTARVRYTNKRSLIGWRDVPIASLVAFTGHDLAYWRTLNIAAHTIVADIADLRTTGTIPRAVTTFEELHQYFDANTGWSASIDELDLDQWTNVQWLVTDLLRFPTAIV
ncbi:MAG: hypothetical protein E6R06_15960 [Mycobacterium sp.]|nr:MAG: hypothetical protein E6R06_15960 [Mycobacterium sp.]